METIIKVDKISKAYRIGVKENAHETLGSAMLSWIKSPLSNFNKLRSLSNIKETEVSDDILWALKDISFEVKRGEVLGIIGKNGAGKSTLLKIISGITEPTSGRIEMYGRVASLLEVGTGFNPELTGRENIYLNGTILGMTKKEIDNKFDEIVDFSGVEKFIDTPIKRYSSGMKVRLAFAVAAFLEPEILVVDEVLAVGDAEFQKKCIGKMEDISLREGRTVLFVSHNMVAVRNLCSRGILLYEGKKTFEGDISECISTYTSKLSVTSSNDYLSHPNRRQGMEAVITKLTMINSKGEESYTFDPFETVTLHLELDGSNYENTIYTISYGIYDDYNTSVVALKSDVQQHEVFRMNKKNVIRCKINNMNIIPGEYGLSVAVTIGGTVKDYIDNAVMFTVEKKDIYGTGQITRQGGLVLVKTEWDSLVREEV